MKLEFAANASFLIRLESGASILTDPWYSDGIYYGAWYNYPPLSPALLDRFLSSRPSYIYISHLHPDHLDGVTLGKFDKATPILIGKLPQPHLLRAIRRLGFTDVRELGLGTAHRESGVEITILPQFEGTRDGTVDYVGYAIDTSLLVRDANGETVLNVVDNPMKAQDAARLREEFGRLDAAILPYSGASFFPHAFPGYSTEEKNRRKEALREARLAEMVEIARVLQPRWIIPAAGSYVMGGRIAHYSKYLHQATPAQLKAHWHKSGGDPEQLKLLTPGDALEVAKGQVALHGEREYDDFTESSRLSYALRLADRPLPQDGVRVPPEFALPWRRLFEKARRNLWASQQRLSLFPQADMEIRLRATGACPVLDEGADLFRFALDRETPYPAGAAPEESADRSFMRFTVDSSLMLMLLLGGAIWNNVEIAGLVECERRPDEYQPTLHSLMSFFIL
jgi:UDP-MurNAc hydroxylase